MSTLDAVEIIAVIRDILIILVMVVGVLAIVLLYWSISRLLKTVSRTADKVSDVVSEVSDKLVKPATAGSGAAFALGKLASIVVGFGSKKNDENDKGRKGENENG